MQFECQSWQRQPTPRSDCQAPAPYRPLRGEHQIDTRPRSGGCRRVANLLASSFACNRVTTGSHRANSSLATQAVEEAALALRRTARPQAQRGQISRPRLFRTGIARPRSSAPACVNAHHLCHECAVEKASAFAERRDPARGPTTQQRIRSRFAANNQFANCSGSETTRRRHHHTSKCP